MNTLNSREAINDIAIIGMSGRFPGAETLEIFWQNLIQGLETIKRFDASDLKAAGFSEELLKDPLYVPCRGVLESIECFDANFFGYSPREAELLDPQHRVFLECAWTALENAGYGPKNSPHLIGVFAGCNQNTYQLFHVLQTEELLMNVHGMAMYADKDFLATRVSYKLNLQGPSYTIQSACSTSLVCVHAACQSLLAGECDIALAGGVSVVFPQIGYFYQPGGVFSPDGHCRAFDKNAAGTLGGDGVGVVVLKRLEEAVRDRDHIYATILGTAVNNDGSEKASYAAPSVEGQTKAVVEAITIANIPAESIGYIETHGTGTPVGDVVEISALTRAFRARGWTTSSCRIGSLKPNIGHLDQAAGVANLIKTALILNKDYIPPSLHVEQVNPEMRLEASPFQVNTELFKWPVTVHPKRAGVSSFGFGGTNVHAVLEQPPMRTDFLKEEGWFILPISAKTDTSLENYLKSFENFFRTTKESLADISFVLQQGRSCFHKRSFLLARSVEEAADILRLKSTNLIVKNNTDAAYAPRLYFLFPGQGTQYVGMSRDLYNGQPVFRKVIDDAAQLLHKFHIDLLSFLGLTDESTSPECLMQTSFAQPILFSVEYALAKLYQAYGILPDAMLGHSLGEYVAASVAGVFSFEEALRLVVLRGKLIQALPTGVMVSIQASRFEIDNLLNEQVALAAVNAPNLCVLSGDEEAISKIETVLRQQGISYQRLHTSHAFHSHMMDSVLENFRSILRSVQKSAPTIPFVSNLTGTWITPEQATSDEYWVQHLRKTVLFSEGVELLLNQASDPLFLELGPGRALSTLVKQHHSSVQKPSFTSTLRKAREQDSDEKIFLQSLGQCWLHGVDVDWTVLHKGKLRHRVPIPTYPFDRVRYFIPPRQSKKDSPMARKIERQPLDKWFYARYWGPAPISTSNLEKNEPQHWVVFTENKATSAVFQRWFSQQNLSLHTAVNGSFFAQQTEDFFIYRQDQLEHVKNILLAARAGKVQESLKLLCIFESSQDDIAQSSVVQAIEHVNHILILLAALREVVPSTISIQLLIATAVTPSSEEHFFKSTIAAALSGIVRVIPQEFSNIHCRLIQYPMQLQSALRPEIFFQEGQSRSSETFVTYIGRSRFREAFENFPVNFAHQISLRRNGVVLITGGLGEVGLQFAEYMAKIYQANLILVSRRIFPEQDVWDEWISQHGEQDPTSQTIRQLQSIQALGGSVSVMSADISDLTRMQVVFHDIKKRFANIDGVIHAAGVGGASAFQGLLETTTQHLSEHWRAKVEGVLVLAKLIEAEKTVSFCLLQSSLFSVIGGPGCAAYAAATSCMDYLAEIWSKKNSKTHWISVDWDAWLPKKVHSVNLKDLTILPEEGYKVFEQLMAFPDMSNVLISTTDLPTRIERWSVKSDDAVEDIGKEKTERYDRPALQTSYVSPNTQIEQTLSEVWQELLGIHTVGIRDDFFELGGHSLFAIQMVARLRELLPISLQIEDLMDHPTIEKLASLIEERLLEKLESMSEDEAMLMMQDGGEHT